MASAECDLKTLLGLLDLSDFFPEKLTRNDMYQITKRSVSDESEMHKCTLIWQFIQRITRFDYRARNPKTFNTSTTPADHLSFRGRAKRKKEDGKTNIHPLDVIAAVFLCCDPTAKQDLVMHLWGCKLAVPFVLHACKGEKVSLYLWPLRSIVCEYQNKEGSTHDLALVKSSMKCIGFMRFGENDSLSKSFLANCLIWGPEKAHPMFFHRDSEGSKPHRSDVSNGMTELGLFIPSGTDNDVFDECHLFANLRGDARDFRDQRNIIADMSSVSIVLSTIENIVKSLDIIKQLLEKGTHVVIVVTEKPVDDKIEEFENLVEEHFPDVPDDCLDIIVLGKKRLSEILSILYQYIKKMDNNKKITLSEFSTYPSKHQSANVDENDDKYLEGMKFTSKIIKCISNVSEPERKKKILPFQGKYWKSWAQADRDYHRFDQMEPREKKYHTSRGKIDDQKKRYRKKQYNILSKKGLSEPLELFLKAMAQLRTDSRKIFIRFLKLELDEMSRNQLKPFYKKYQDLVHKSASSSEDERKNIRDEFARLDDENSNIMLGLEHITRELGQIYEACEYQPVGKEAVILIKTPKIVHTDIPQYASILLQEGYPIEIFDGEAEHVPVMWINAIINDLKEKVLMESKLHAISVLGIQSSGKSTCLNTMFGLQFAVSAGRCTRGAFIQLVKVESSISKDIQTDYVVVIDTEGLKGDDISSDMSVKHDNELSTFVIGLTDTTVINLMGENSSYLQENLPIAVHAFLRMNLVGLHPRCTIVHQNVDKRNREKLLQQGQILESILNKLTEKACELEKIPHKHFKDIIEFSITEHTDYIPALFEGEQPMAPISTGYSSESNHVRKKLVRFIHNAVTRSTISDFGKHLTDLWNAIMTDRFVYEFQTTIETESKLKLENKYSDQMHITLEEINVLVLKHINQLTQNNFDKIKATLSKELKKVQDENKNKFKRYIDSPDKTSINFFQKWREDYLKRLDVKFTEYQNSACQQLEEAHASKQGSHQKALPIEVYGRFLLLLKTQQTPGKADDDSFREATEVSRQHNIDLHSAHKSTICQDTTNELQQIYSAHKHLINEDIVSKTNLEAFNQIKDLTKYINSENDDEIKTAHTLLKRLKITVKRELQSELSKIKLSQVPYSARYPAQVLFRIKEHLNNELAEDKARTIWHQFQIDLMISVGGTIINAMGKITNQRESQEIATFERIKSSLQELTNGELDTIACAINVMHIVFQSTVLNKFQLEIRDFFIKELMKSSGRNQIRTGRDLRGICMSQIVLSRNTSLLKLYNTSPKMALVECLNMLFKNLFTSNWKTIQTHISDMILKEFESILANLEFFNVKGNTKEFMQLFKLMFPSVSTDNQYLDFFIAKNRHGDIVHMQPLIETFTSMRESVVKEVFEMISTHVRFNEDDIFTVCTDALYNRLGVCTSLCPFCDEMCMFAENHAGPHFSSVHKPVMCSAVDLGESVQRTFESCPHHIYKNNTFKYNEKLIQYKDYRTVYPEWDIKGESSESSSCLWKWIYVNNKDLFEFPKELSVEWGNITEKKVKDILRHTFNV